MGASNRAKDWVGPSSHKRRWVPFYTEQDTGWGPGAVLTLSEENKPTGFIKTFFTVEMPYGCTTHK